MKTEVQKILENHSSNGNVLTKKELCPKIYSMYRGKQTSFYAIITDLK